MKIKIPLALITDNYAKQTGDLGAKAFLKEELEKGGFDLNKHYTKKLDEVNHLLICEQIKSND